MNGNWDNLFVWRNLLAFLQIWQVSAMKSHFEIWVEKRSVRIKIKTGTMTSILVPKWWPCNCSNDLGTATMALDDIGTATMTLDDLGTATMTLDDLGTATMTLGDLGTATMTLDDLGTATMTLDDLGTATMTLDLQLWLWIDLGTAAMNITWKLHLKCSLVSDRNFTYLWDKNNYSVTWIFTDVFAPNIRTKQALKKYFITLNRM